MQRRQHQQLECQLTVSVDGVGQCERGHRATSSSGHSLNRPETCPAVEGERLQQGDRRLRRESIGLSIAALGMLQLSPRSRYPSESDRPAAPWWPRSSGAERNLPQPAVRRTHRVTAGIRNFVGCDQASSTCRPSAVGRVDPAGQPAGFRRRVFEPRGDVALLFHPPERDVDGPALQAAARGRYELEPVGLIVSNQQLQDDRFFGGKGQDARTSGSHRGSVLRTCKTDVNDWMSALHVNRSVLATERS